MCPDRLVEVEPGGDIGIGEFDDLGVPSVLSIACSSWTIDVPPQGAVAVCRLYTAECQLLRPDKLLTTEIYFPPTRGWLV